MAHWLKPFVLTEDLGSVSGFTWQLTTAVQWGPMPPSDLFGHCTHMVQIHIFMETHIHIK